MAEEVNFYEIHADYATFFYDASIIYDLNQPMASAQTGKAVSMTGEATVGLTDNGTEIKGKVFRVHSNGTCSVQDRGYADLPSTGVITYTGANNGLVGSATRGAVKAATAVPAIGAVRRAQAIKNDGTDVTIVDLG